MKTIILAAGYATRLYPLTKNKPKALLPLKDGLILDKIITKIANLYEYIDEIEAKSSEAEAEIVSKHEIIIVSNALFYEQFIEYIKSLEGRYQNLKFSCINDGSTSPETRLGAIKDIELALRNQQKEEEILVLASDNLFDYELKEAYEIFKKTGMHLIFAEKIDDISSLNFQAFALAELDSQNLVLRIEEKPKLAFSNNIVYATYFYQASIARLISEMLADGKFYDSPGLLPVYLHSRGEKIKAYLFEGSCIDIGTKEAYFKLLSTK